MLRFGILCLWACMLFPFSGLCAAFDAGDGGGAARTAEEPGLFAVFAKRLSDTWNSDEYDIYIPVNTWHNRLTYDADKARRYNENPWGAGFGRSMRDEDGDSHFLFIMGFQDSYNRFEPYGGYAFQKNWHFSDNKDWSAGVGYVLGITARDQYNYIPFPLPLPIAGIQYKNLAVQAAYIPGGYNNGNVLFTWLRWHID